MKKRIQTMIIFAAMICMSISGCSERTVTPTNTSVTTEASVTEVTENSQYPQPWLKLPNRLQRL